MYNEHGGAGCQQLCHPCEYALKVFAALIVIDALPQKMRGEAKPGAQPWVLGGCNVFHSREVKTHILVYSQGSVCEFDSL